MPIVAEEPVCNRRLWTHRLQCRVIAQGRHGGIKSRIRYPANTDVTIVMWNRFHQPVYGVIGIAGLIHIRGFGFMGIERANILEFPFAHPPAPYILEYHDIPLAEIILLKTIPEIRPPAFSVRSTRIRCSG